MKSSLDIIESVFKSLFEGDSSLLHWMGAESTLIHKLIEATQDCLLTWKQEAEGAPDKFTIYISSEDREFHDKQPEWIEAAQKIIVDLASESGIIFEQPPQVQIVTRNSLEKGEVLVKAFSDPANTGRTNIVPVLPEPELSKTNSPECKAALILEDEKVFPLENCVINIGRKSTNHLVISDLRVSRTHAQLRYVEDGFIIFDIGSSGGTYINGERISQRKLKPGDVISLGGIKLIYTEENMVTSQEIASKSNTTKPFQASEVN